MMLLTYIATLFFLFPSQELEKNFDSIEIRHSIKRHVQSNEVLVKSTLSKESDKVFVQITLPNSSNVGFEIFNDQGRIQHLWHNQKLESGHHRLSLDLPILGHGKYLLHIKVEETIYKHLVFLK